MKGGGGGGGGGRERIRNNYKHGYIGSYGKLLIICTWKINYFLLPF